MTGIGATAGDGDRIGGIGGIGARRLAEGIGAEGIGAGDRCQALRPALDTDLVLEPRDPGFAATGLRVPSTLQLHRLMTVSAALIRRQLGHLSPELQARTAEGLRLLFG